MTLDTHDVLDALERRFNPPSKPAQYATFRELSDASQRRRIDFIAVNTWLSRGHHIQGVEVKVQRADWLRELARPKADEWFAITNHWWLATVPGVVRDGELPATWGLLELHPWKDEHRLKVIVKAPTLQPDRAWPSWFVMRLLARNQDRRRAEPQEVIDAREDGYQKGVAQGKTYATLTREQEHQAQRMLSEMLEALGLPVWGGRHETRVEQIRRALVLVEKGDLSWQAESMAKRYREAADAVLKAVAE